MKNIRYHAARIVLLVMGTPTFLYGFFAMYSPSSITKMTNSIYEAQVHLSPEIEYMLKPLGLYVLMMGLIILFGALNPSKYRFALWVAALLFITRGLQRLYLSQQMAMHFKVKTAANTGVSVYLVFIGCVALYLAMQKKLRSSS